MSKVLYRYYCKMRPPATGSIPKRNLHEAVAARINVVGERRQMYGFADYTHPLTDEEIEAIRATLPEQPEAVHQVQVFLLQQTPCQPLCAPWQPLACD